MNTTDLHIKNMVCNRCIRVVHDELSTLGYTVKNIELGEVKIAGKLTARDMDQISEMLNDNGFELIDDRKSQLITQIKTLIIEYIHHDREKPEHMNMSDFLARELAHDYSYLSHLFSSVEGTTIEKYLINQKIEKVKELLIYDELSLNEIAFKLGYSSVQHLSIQFKKTTGLTPSHFRKLKKKRRKPIDQV